MGGKSEVAREKILMAFHKLIVKHDALLRFLLQQISLCYVARSHDYIYRFLAEMSENTLYLKWLSQYYANLAYPAVTVHHAKAAENAVLDSCILATYGIYGIIYSRYHAGCAFEYAEVLETFSDVLLTRLRFEAPDSHIKKAIDVFENLDKQALLEI